jgi:S1-C subfamily serine protease
MGDANDRDGGEQSTEPGRAPEAPTVFVLHLTGSRRGASEPLSFDTIRIGTAADADIHFRPSHEPAVAEHHATLSREGSTYRLVVAEGRVVRVNGQDAVQEPLASGDVVEVGDGGPLLRLRFETRPVRAYKTVGQALGDCVDCARHGSSHLPGKAWLFLKSMPRELFAHTSPATRAIVSLIVAVSLFGIFALGLFSWRLERRLDAEAARLGEISALIEGSESPLLSPSELRRIRDQLEVRITDAEERVVALEERSLAARRVIAAASPSIIFLQGAYGFLDPEENRPLREVLGPDGEPLRRPFGPEVSPTGEGQIVLALFTGTGFVATEDGLVITNRHVAAPWDFDERAKQLAGSGLQPFMHRLVGYLPGQSEPFDVELVLASETVDLAVVRSSTTFPLQVTPLALREEPAQAGDEVLVLGYPTGVRALLARSSPEFVDELTSEAGVDFWTVARRLSDAGLIEPLATQGIVGQVTETRIVYDAETSSGGSGGPVLAYDQGVVAINTAILSEFGGSNLGVPAGEARELLARVLADRPTDQTDSVAPAAGTEPKL